MVSWTSDMIGFIYEWKRIIKAIDGCPQKSTYFLPSSLFSYACSSSSSKLPPSPSPNLSSPSPSTFPSPLTIVQIIPFPLRAASFFSAGRRSWRQSCSSHFWQYSYTIFSISPDAAQSGDSNPSCYRWSARRFGYAEGGPYSPFWSPSPPTTF